MELFVLHGLDYTISVIFRVGRRPISCRCGLPRPKAGRFARAEGVGLPEREARAPKGPRAAARGEGRSQWGRVESWNEESFATFRPSRRRSLSDGGTPLGKPAAVQWSRRRRKSRWWRLLSAGNRGADAVVVTEAIFQPSELLLKYARLSEGSTAFSMVGIFQNNALVVA